MAHEPARLIFDSLSESQEPGRDPSVPAFARGLSADHTGGAEHAASALVPHGRWLATAGCLAGLGLVVQLSGHPPWMDALRVGIAILAWGVFLGAVYGARRVPNLVIPITDLTATGALIAVAALGTALHDGAAAMSINLALTLVLGGAAIYWLGNLALARQHQAIRTLERALNGQARRVTGATVDRVSWQALRPGEEILIDAGEVLCCDAVLLAGSIAVQPWPDSRDTATKEEGQFVVSGARVLTGKARARVTWTGTDRAWLRLLRDPARKADHRAPLTQLARQIAWRAGMLAAVVALIASFAGAEGTLAALSMATAAGLAFGNLAVPLIARLWALYTVLKAAREGIAFHDAEVLHRAGHVSAAAFCARGTLLLGEPTVAVIHPTARLIGNEVLALAAGAEVGQNSPVAVALARAARAQGVRVDAARNPSVVVGQGIMAIASSGEGLIVGSRALLLRERISIAAAEELVAQLETAGRSALLVALDERLVGVIGLQDGLQSGARAAVQHLLDVHVEPVLMSSDARDTCEAMGRALDIEHLRPELLPGERTGEVKRLAASGHIVAVIGTSPVDDEPMRAANVSIALDTAGSAVTQWGVQLASGDVRYAALAIRLAHEYRRETQLGLSLVLTGGGLCAVAAFFGAPPALVPLGVLAGLVTALSRLQADRDAGSRHAL